MPAGKYNLVIEKGATLDTQFTWKTKDNNGIEEPVNLTGWKARAHIRTEKAAATAILELTSEGGSPTIILGGAAGTIELDVADEATAAITENEGVWDLELESASGRVTRLLEGKVKITDEVTR